jgi:hypothetical protein
VTTAERAALRAAIIAGPTDCALDAQEAATFMGVSESWLRSSDVPRAPVAGVKYLKSQCLLYVRCRLSHQLLDPMEKAS